MPVKVETNRQQPSSNRFLGTDFRDEAEVGWGFSGLVLKSLHLPSNQILARKIIHETPRKRTDLSLNRRREVEFYEKIMQISGERCGNIVKCFGILPVGEMGHIHGGLVFEFMDLGSMTDFFNLHNHKPVPEPIILRIAHGLLQACAQLESIGIVHRDIKPSNILFDSRGGVKLCDFGEACFGWESEDGGCENGRMTGSTAYMSPERLAGRPHSYPSDIWSFGLIILELTCNCFPFDTTPFDGGGCSIIELWEAVMETDQLPQVQNQNYSNDLVELVNISMKRNPLERPTATELLKKYSALFKGMAEVEDFINFIRNEK